MKRFLPTLLVCLLPQAGFAIPLVLSTATNPQGTGNNQGWWSPTLINTADNDNYLAGSNFAGALRRNYFGFDTSALSGLIVNSATLVLPNGSGSGAANLNFNLSAVTVSISALSDKASSPDASLFNALAGGTSYGSYVLSTAASGPFSFVLNAAALADLQLAAASSNFFILGGSSPQGEAFGLNSHLFGSSGGGAAATLVLDVSAPDAPEFDGSQAVSAFATLALLTLAGSRRLKTA